MVDTPVVAVLHGIQDLQEDTLGQVVLTNILAALGDVVEQVTLGAVVQHNVNAVRAVHDLQHGDDIRVVRGLVVESDFPLLESKLPAVQGHPIGVELA